MSPSQDAVGKVGQEIRVALYVVGVLALLFCALLYARIYGRGPSLPDVSITLDGSTTRIEPARYPHPPQPTIVRGGNWDELREPADVNVAGVAPPPPEPTIPSLADRAASARRIIAGPQGDPLADPTLRNPRQPDGSEIEPSTSAEPF